MCESFNNWVIGPRHKAVVTMCEEIRTKLMKRNADMIKFTRGWPSNIAPMALKMLESNKEIAQKCQVSFNGDVGFEVWEGNYKHTVNLRTKTCSCRLWQLKGIPCPHAISSYYEKDLEPEDFIDHWYHRGTFLRAYESYIQPVSSISMWPETGILKIDPPETKPMPGRPKISRRKDKDEGGNKNGKLAKSGARMTCSLCGELDHNKRGCPNKDQGLSANNAELPTTHSNTGPQTSQLVIPPSFSQDMSRIMSEAEQRALRTQRARGRGRGR